MYANKIDVNIQPREQFTAFKLSVMHVMMRFTHASLGNFPRFLEKFFFLFVINYISCFASSFQFSVLFGWSRDGGARIRWRRDDIMKEAQVYVEV